MKRIALSFLVLLTLIIGCKKTNDLVDAQPKTVSDLVAETPTFSLLKAALQEAGLNDALKATNLTVFAPTDDAFKARGFSSPESFKNISDETLRNVLRYHLISGVVTTQTPELASAVNLPVETSNASALFLTNASTGLFVNGSRVTKSDQLAANGIVHTIDNLLWPPANDALTALKSRADVSILVAAITRIATFRPDLLAILDGTTTNQSLKQITLFAPSDAAFAAAGFRTVADINNASLPTLANLISYHAIQGRLFSNQLQAGQVATLNSSATNRLTIAVPASGPTVKGNRNTTPATIKGADVASKNAVIHVIDQVLQP
ncbi:fasciclin domain-containing protein [Fibrella aquatica]|uniref:fasciclin domain-containing protein n=1 Tax=Fibrella aquatica TaxID=3242487 RepID=UPI003522FC09